MGGNWGGSKPLQSKVINKPINSQWLQTLCYLIMIPNNIAKCYDKMVSRQRTKFKRLSAILKIPNTHIPKGSIQILQLFSPDSVHWNLLCGDCPAIFCSSIAKHARFDLKEFAQKVNSIHSVFVFLVKNKPAIIAKFSWPASISLLSTGIPLMENSDCLFVIYIHRVTVYIEDKFDMVTSYSGQIENQEAQFVIKSILKTGKTSRTMSRSIRDTCTCIS